MNSIKSDPDYNYHESWWYRPGHIRISDSRFMSGIYPKRAYENGGEVKAIKKTIPDGYISSKEASKLTERTYETLQFTALQKRIRCLKLNNKNYYQLDDLLAYSKIARGKHHALTC